MNLSNSFAYHCIYKLNGNPNLKHAIIVHVNTVKNQVIIFKAQKYNPSPQFPVNNEIITPCYKGNKSLWESVIVFILVSIFRIYNYS